jgi:hypothetical protein
VATYTTTDQELEGILAAKAREGSLTAVLALLRRAMVAVVVHVGSTIVLPLSARRRMRSGSTSLTRSASGTSATGDRLPDVPAPEVELARLVNKGAPPENAKRL